MSITQQEVQRVSEMPISDELKERILMSMETGSRYSFASVDLPEDLIGFANAVAISLDQLLYAILSGFDSQETLIGMSPITDENKPLHLDEGCIILPAVFSLTLPDYLPDLADHEYSDGSDFFIARNPERSLRVGLARNGDEMILWMVGYIHPATVLEAKFSFPSSMDLLMENISEVKLAMMALAEMDNTVPKLMGTVLDDMKDLTDRISPTDPMESEVYASLALGLVSQISALVETSLDRFDVLPEVTLEETTLGRHVGHGLSGYPYIMARVSFPDSPNCVVLAMTDSSSLGKTAIDHQLAGAVSLEVDTVGLTEAQSLQLKEKMSISDMVGILSVLLGREPNPEPFDGEAGS